MNWLDKYIMKNDKGYLMNGAGGLFVELDDEYVRHVKGDDWTIDLIEISKEEFIKRLIN
jgi:hypothetical protein